MHLRRDWDGPWKWLAAFGLVSLTVGISGQAVKASEIEIGALTSLSARVGLITLGLSVFALAILQQESSPAGPDDSVQPAGQLPAQESTERRRLRELQEVLGLHGDDVDGLWGPITRARCQQKWVGSKQHVAVGMARRLNGNRSRPLVAWVQRQLNRKYSVGLLEDGIPGLATHRAIVERLGESDGIVGPRGYRILVLD